MRVYVPATLDGLVELERTGQLGEPPFAAYAVTSALREWYGAGEPEEHEWAAAEEAALGSLRLLADGPAAARRRVVLPVDVPGDAVRTDDRLGPAGVRVLVPVALRDVASVHVDGVEASGVVAAAAAALAAAESGDAAAARALEALDDHALEWYATQELADLLR